MKVIQPPIGKSGPKVSNLHKGLLFLLLGESMTENERKMRQAQLAPEVRTQTFGPWTMDLVGTYQLQLKNRPDLPQSLKNKVKYIQLDPTGNRGNGVVDDPTAEGLNWLLKKNGVLAKAS